MCTFSEVIQMLPEADAPDTQAATPATKEKLAIMQTMLRELQTKLAVDEEIIDYLPLTNAHNTAVETSGWMGLSHATKPLAQQYMQLFDDLRGNRLLLFTNQRMLLVFPVDFFEAGRFTSYFYQDIPGIMLRQNKASVWTRLLKKKNEASWYVLDFQSKAGIFSETLQPFQKEQFLKTIAKIPAAQAVPIGSRLRRKNKFDQIVNNFEYTLKVGYFFNFLWFLLLLLLLLGVFAGIGPFHGLNAWLNLK